MPFLRIKKCPHRNTFYHELFNFTSSLREQFSDLFEKNSFCRKRFFTVEIIFLFIVHLIKRKNVDGYASSMDRFIGDISSNFSFTQDKIPTAAAFTKARNKIPWELFYRLALKQAELINQKNKKITLWKTHNVLGVDGCKIYTPKSNELCQNFSHRHYKQGDGHYPQASFLAVVNVFNGTLQSFSLDDYKVHENRQLKSVFDKIPQNSILLLDRGFCFAENFYQCD